MPLTIVDQPSAALLGPPNEGVFAYLDGLSAHSDIVTPLLAALEPLAGVEVHCPDRERFGYVIAAVAGRVFAFAAGMQGVALRLPPADAAAARTRGGSAVQGLDPEWTLLPLFGDGGFAGQLDEYARRAFAHARKPVATRVGLWIAVSATAFVLPMVFAKI